MSERIVDLRYATWAEWRRRVYDILFGADRFVEGKFLFRGVRDADWELVSSFDRYAPAIPIARREETAEALLRLFGEECEELDLPAFDEVEPRVAAAQHNGLPTRALDWTESPFIAAYFAFSELNLREVEHRGEAAIWALDLADPAWTGTLGARIMKVPSRGNDRLLRQRGRFTYLSGPFHSLEDYVAHIPHDGTALWRFRFPRSEAPAVVADLVAMGITATRLFPDRTGAARAAVLRHALLAG